jgi:hypothetical protein
MSFSRFQFWFWRLPTSAADLKFLHRLLHVRNRNFKSKSGTGIKYLPVPLLFPKFVSVPAAKLHELRKRGTGGISNKVSNAEVT